MDDDFLAREQAIMGGSFPPPGAQGASSIDFDAAVSAFPALDDFDLQGSIGQVAAPLSSLSNGFGEGFGDFENVPSFNALPTTITDVKVTGDDELENFESQFPDLGVDAAPSQQQQTYQPPFLVQPQSRSSFQTAPNEVAEEEEPEVIREWRLKQEEEIRRRDEDSAQKKRETVAKAEQAIDDFYKEYNTKIERNVKQNKDDELEFAEKLAATLSSGTTWNRICDLVELQNSQSKTIARAGPGTTDLTRFKEVLLRLKREGETAPGAGGY